MNAQPSQPRRAVAAAKRIAFAKKGRPGPSPLDFVEAISIAELHQREQRIDSAAAMLADSADAPAAAKEIADAYFVDLPRLDATPDGPEYPGMGTDVPDGTKPGSAAPAPATGAGKADPTAVGEPLKGRDDRRGVNELEDAAEVLIRATLLSFALRKAALLIMGRIRRLAMRMLGRDRSAAMVLDVKATELQRASKAAGTKSPALNMRGSRARPAHEAEMIEKAIARGADTEAVEAILRFSREYDDLHQHGVGPRQTREHFIETNMRVSRSQ
tara:strand:+ start:80495 stop:81310 length:816 start_codon:yes stop_codon:yes gene_type:complete